MKNTFDIGLVWTVLLAVQSECLHGRWIQSSLYRFNRATASQQPEN